MTDIAFEGGLRRLRISGPCGSADAATVHDAVTSIGRDSPRLTIDLTAVPTMAPEVAASLVRAARTVEEQGCRVTLLRKCHSVVDQQLQDLDR